MNELQVKLTADITALQSALTRAKKTIQSFESDTNKESEKGNVGFRRKIGLIEQLTNKAKNLRTALSQATNETQIAKYNAQLEDTTREMARLNALGRGVSQNLNATAGGFGNVARQGTNANGVAIEFNRVIQDSPFGLIGVGNNLQQLAGNFAQVSRQAGGTGAAVKASLASIISPVNLGLLAVSALTAGFTAYQMGAFDGIFATKDFTEELEKFKDTLNAVDSARIDALNTSDKEITTINSLRLIIEDETNSREVRNKAIDELQSKYPNYFANLDREKILAGEVAQAYEEVTKQLIAKAEVESSVKRIVDLNEQERLILEQNKNNLEEIQEVRQRIAKFQADADKAELEGLNAKDAFEKDLALRRKTSAENQIRFLRGENEAVDQLLKIEEDRAKLTDIANNALKETLVNTENVKKSTDQFVESLDEQVQKLGLISGITAEIKDLNEQRELATEQEEINLLTGQINLLKQKLSLINAIAKRANTPIDQGITPLGPRDGIINVSDPVVSGVTIPDEVQSQVEENLKNQKALVDELSGSYAGLGSLIGKAFDNPQFGAFLGQFIPFAAKLIGTNFKVGKSAAIAKGAQDSIFGGPFSTGAFIAAAVGLVASAFASIGGSGGGGGIGQASSGAPPQIFTNANTVQPPSPSTPSPSGSIDFERAQGSLEARISGEDIVFVYDRYKERQRGGG